MSSDRGEWRGIYTVLPDTPEFQDLGPEAQLIWFHLKLRLGAAGIDTLPAAEYVLSDSTGIPSEGVRDGIAILCARGWLARERTVFWLRNALKFEPSRNLANDNHLKSIRSHILGLPKLSIVNDFAEYYGMGPPFPDLIPSEGYRDGTPDYGERRTENGERKDTPQRAREGRDETFGLLPPTTIISLKGLYGWAPDDVIGTDEGIWPPGMSHDDRRRCLATAVHRLEGEGRAYNGRFFRRILEAVVEEQGSATATPDHLAHQGDFPEPERFAS